MKEGDGKVEMSYLVIYKDDSAYWKLIIQIGRAEIRKWGVKDIFTKNT